MQQTNNNTILILGLLLAAAYPSAWAQSQDPLTLNAAYSVQTDSNLFRQSSGAVSEQIAVTNVGLAFTTRQSLQQFELNASLVDYQYQKFNSNNHTAANYDAAWRWSLTPRWRGNLTSSRNEPIRDFANSSGVPLNTASALDTEYEIDGPWRVVGGVSTSRQANQAAASGDSSANAADMGARYAFASGSSITYRLRTNQGAYLNPPVGQLDNAYKQIDHDLRLHWTASGNSTVDANLTYSTRSHPSYAQRDFEGLNTGINLNWQLSGKSALNLGYQHVLGAYETANSNYSQTGSITLGPVWQLSPKMVLRLQSRFEQVQYLGSPTAVPASDRRDTNRSNTLLLNWQPYQKLSLITSIGSLSRGSNVAGVDYDATQISLTAQLSY